MQKSATFQPEVLKMQQIDDLQPGTILRDFQTLLDFVGTAGINTGGKNYRLPLATLSELDERMTHPLRPRKTRPQQVSYPHLNGLYLLLRATGLGVSSGEGNNGRLSVNPERLAEWSDLNPEERYFTLFQAMLAASWELIDAERSSRSGVWNTLSRMLGRRKTMFSSHHKQGGVPASELLYGWENQTVVALLELFGILEIGRIAQQEGENWRIDRVETTPFGQAFLQKFTDPDVLLGMITDERQDADDRKHWLGEFYREFFPNCVNTLSHDDCQFVDGVWQFQVSLGDVWRRIIIPAELNADDLAFAIIDAFKFDDDHFYEFKVRNRSGRRIQIAPGDVDDADYYTDEFAIGRLPLDPGQTMTFDFDFGDTWEFTVKLEKILPLDMSLDGPKIIAKKGKAPRQYRYDDW